MLLTANRVDRVAEILCHMEFVEADLLLGIGHILLGRGDVGCRHIHRNSPNPGQLRLRQALIIARQTLAGTTIGHMDNMTALLIDNCGHILVSPLERCLIDGNILHGGNLSTAKTTSHGAVHHTVYAFPTQTHLPRYRRG